MKRLPFPTWFSRAPEIILKQALSKGKVVSLESDALIFIKRCEASA